MLRKTFRSLNNILNIFRRTQTYSPTVDKIDVVIPVVEKDIHILPLCLAGIKECVNHSIVNIYIVAPETTVLRDFCIKENVSFVKETDIFGFNPNDMSIQVGVPKVDRSGWIFQQLIKLSGIVNTSRYFLVIDSDHILLQPHTFISSENKLIFYYSSEYHEPYYRNIEKLMGRYPQSAFSYVAHKMIFDTTLLSEMKKGIEQRHNTSWYKAIINSLDEKEVSGFSEFELFGNYVPKKDKILVP
ncbi:hypothetical protein EZS27_019259 [termite gut metagenome]|uniref:Uncharacterized protein n=1 Tax=termite gut metagenome TaxID=433724 RepID=A0A5J4REY0_9ZZZZ